MNPQTKKEEPARENLRMPVLEQFNISVELEDKAPGLLLQVRDVSESGIGISLLDREGNTPEYFHLWKGESLHVRFYMSSGLFIRLKIQLARVELQEGVRVIGGFFLEKESQEYQAFLSFISLLDQYSSVLQTVA